VSATLDELSAMGVRCSMDDFGTGYSGLSYLSRFPISALKIDKSFVAAIKDGSPTDRDASIVRAVIALARGLGVLAIAEGVETQEQLYFLLRNGCDQMQGFLSARPCRSIAFGVDGAAGAGRSWTGPALGVGSGEPLIGASEGWTASGPPGGQPAAVSSRNRS